MKNPLRYQISEYDCGPTSMLNALSYLFPRKEIPPELIRNIMLYSLDCYGKDGTPGKSGTSRLAMMFLSNWLDGVGKSGLLKISSEYLRGEKVFIGRESLINDCLNKKGAAVVRLFLGVEHYVLLTCAKGEKIYLFDPYYDLETLPAGIEMYNENFFDYNRAVPFENFNRETKDFYAFGPIENREAVLLFNDKIKMTAESSIEYFI